MSSITIQEKQTFLRHFLNQYTMQNRVCRWILSHLLEGKNLEKIHFVDSINGYKNALIMATDCANDEGDFLGVLEGSRMHDPEKMFSVLQFNDEDEFYIELRFSDRMLDPHFLSVLEENKRTRIRISAKEKIEVEALLQHSIESNVKNVLMAMINRALDEGNEERFKELSAQYREMMGK